MSERATQILADALQLPATERAAMVEQLLSSLDRPDPRLDTLWAQEAESRIAAYEAGRMEAFPAEEVFAEAEP
jgi:putative addiction module component (TIGR02574 family)